MNALRACFERFVQDHPAPTHLGDVEVAAVVGNTGDPISVVVTTAGPLKPLRPCLQAAVEVWRFPRASQSYEVQFPLRLQ